MITLCKLFNVSENNYAIKPKSKRINKGQVNREIDFFLLNNSNEYKCEVKLMGKGNPESADTVIARDSSLFVADKLSDQNKAQLDQLKVEWIELRDENGYKRFKVVLDNFKIPYNQTLDINLDEKIDEIFNEIFN